jgi:hypothetical protein
MSTDVWLIVMGVVVLVAWLLGVWYGHRRQRWKDEWR